MSKGPKLPRGGGGLRCYLVQFWDALLRNVTITKVQPFACKPNTENTWRYRYNPPSRIFPVLDLPLSTQTAPLLCKPSDEYWWVNETLKICKPNTENTWRYRYNLPSRIFPVLDLPLSTQTAPLLCKPSDEYWWVNETLKIWMSNFNECSNI